MEKTSFNFVVLGTSALTATLTRVLHQAKHPVTAIAALPRSERPEASFDLRALATELAVPYREYADINGSRAVAEIRELAPDFILSTWPRKIGKDILAAARYSVVGTHPTYLPANRGRHPLHWAIVLGLQHMAVSFYRMNEQFDRGPIIHLQPFELREGDTINDANRKMNDAASQGLRDLLQRLSSDPHLGINQMATTGGNYWRARTIHDVVIDPRLSASSIIAIVRSFCPPYPGACLIVGSSEIRIAEAWLLETCLPDHAGQGRQEYGRLIQSSPTEFSLICGDGCKVAMRAVEPIAASLPNILHPPTFYILQNRPRKSRAPDLDAATATSD